MKIISAVEIRTAIRGLIRTPTITVSAVLCLALGIGATTAISSAINRALLQPLPFRDAEHLVAIFRTTPQSGPNGDWPHSPANYLDLAGRTRQLSDVASINNATALVRLADHGVRASRLDVSGNLFPLLGAQPFMGRFLTVADDDSRRPLVAVISHEFWQSTMGSDSTLIGKPLFINGEAAIVVGIAAPQFRIPVGNRLMGADLWMPSRWSAERQAVRNSNSLSMIGRLAPNATAATADRELRAIFAGIIGEHPELRGESVRAADLETEGSQSIRSSLLLVFGAVCLVLLIACTNVASLLLARAVQRRKEVAVRIAIGASRWDTIRLALAESLILSLIGGGLGLALAFAGVRTIGVLAASRIPRLEGMTLDGNTVLFAVLLSVMVAVLCGIVPAWRSASVNPQDAMGSGRGGGIGRGQQRLLRGLVMVEVGLSLTLLIAGGLALKGFSTLLSHEPGFETAHVMTFTTTIATANYPKQSELANFLEPALLAIEAIPGVEHAGAISSVPFVSWGNNSNTRYEGQPNADPTTFPIVEMRAITPGFFATTGQRLIAGRILQPSDRENAPDVVVVNQALVARDLKGRDPVGVRFHTSDTTFATIVGVVSNIGNMGPFSPAAPEMYWSYRQSGGGSSFPIMVRVSSNDPLSVVSAIRAAIRQIDRTAAVARVSTMDATIALSLGSPRFYFSLMAAFAVAALILAMAGLYGVLSYVVAQRTREMGIRAALGSSGTGIVQLVVADGSRLLLGGLLLGVASAVAVTRFMTFMLYGVNPLDTVAWVVAMVLIVMSGILASIIPAWRATRVDPLIAMRAE